MGTPIKQKSLKQCCHKQNCSDSQKYAHCFFTFKMTAEQHNNYADNKACQHQDSAFTKIHPVSSFFPLCKYILNSYETKNLSYLLTVI